MTTSVAKPTTTATTRKSRKASTPKAAAKNDHLKTWATAGVVVMAVLSALLNGYANSQEATVTWAGWGMGLVIPVVILILGKVAGLLYKRGQKPLAYFTGGAGAGLLFLSVWHCATSISMLTGSPLLLAFPMAVAIDVGFVACEISALMAE